LVQIEVNFKGAPPATLGGGQVRIGEGKYLFDITEVKHGNSQAGREMVTVTLRVRRGGGPNPEEFTGKALTERFVIDRQDEDKLFGLQRFHGFLQGVYGQEFGDQTVRIDTDDIVNRQVLADVRDKEEEARGEYAARTVSQCTAFFNPAQAQQAAQAAQAQPAAATPAPAAPAVAPVATPVEAAVAAVVAPVAAVTPTPAPEAQSVDQAAAAVDSLFES
jgi:hypothetical protein